jgi:lipase chaperone LimK
MARLLFVAAIGFAVAAWIAFPGEGTTTVLSSVPIGRVGEALTSPSPSTSRSTSTFTAKVDIGANAKAQQWARSLAGTGVDGRWSQDGRGRLVAGADIIRLFDYFLSATGEEPAEAIRAHVAATAREQLAAQDQEAALALYDRYVGYRAAVQSGLADATPGDARAALALVEATQQQIFGGDATALFGDDNALAEVTLDRRDLLARQDLDDDERAAALAALEQRLPASMRAARAARAQLAAAVAAELAR